MSTTEQRSAIAGAIIALTVASFLLLAVLGAIYTSRLGPTAEPIRLVEVTTTTSNTTAQWIDCYHDEDTERWVPNLPVPAPGECP